jgi:hypothetical protein
MYVVNSYNPEETPSTEEEEAPKTPVSDTGSKMVRQGSKTDNGPTTDRKLLNESEPEANIEDEAEERDNVSKENIKRHMLSLKVGMKLKSEVKKYIADKNLYDEKEGYSENVEIVFTPYVDSNQLNILYNNKSAGQEQNSFYNVE